MKLVFLSDTHSYLNKIDIPEGDVLIHCGDALSSGRLGEFKMFCNDLKFLADRFDKILYTPGNHDICVEQMPDICRAMLRESSPKIEMLIHERYEYGGIKFWGSPYTPRFMNWAFMYDREKGEEIWKEIYWDTDVLFTHGMPKGIFDSVGYVIGVGDERVGCEALLARIKKIKPRIFAGGHLHLEGGQQVLIDGTFFINAAICDHSYIPTRMPFKVETKAWLGK